MPAVVFTAPCPECGGDATWRQDVSSGLTVVPGDFTIGCLSCDVPAERSA